MSDQSRELRELDTNILHSFLLKEVFNIDTNRQEDLNYLSYLRGNMSTIKMLDKEEDYAGFLGIDLHQNEDGIIELL